jgi:murein DD-endopeptidase MepM/ murein hydrolase activator NlpD
VLKRVLILLSFAVTLPLAAGSGGAGTTDSAAGSTARAYGIQILVPGQPAAGTPILSAPQDAVQFGGVFAYPADASIASAASVTLSVSADSGAVATSTASTEVLTLSLFGGEITADSVSVKSTGTATPDRGSGDLSQSALTNLAVLGQPVTATANQRVQLADWGYAILLEQSTAEPVGGTPGFRGFVTGLDIHLTADHKGLPAGSEVLVGYAEANVQAPKPPPLPIPPTVPVPGERYNFFGKAKAPEPNINGIPGLVKPPPNVTPKLTAGGYVFPVYGPSSFIDTFGAPRADVSWHHGDDIFAPLGAPLLACASGTVFSVGWNQIGGNRLWIRDQQGNEFYYAHLSAFSPLALNGAHVNAGDVIGFLGNSGDAQGTPYHLHFEVHPVGLLPLGYDGAVDPTSYLSAWERLKDVPITAAGAWAPTPAPGTQAPKPGAILLQLSDISSASGLDPASLQRAIAPVSSEGDGALLRLAAATPKG